MTLEEVDRFLVSEDLVDRTESKLRTAGGMGHEMFVLWSGVKDDGVFHVRTGHVPEQTAYRLESGLCVRVEGQALHNLNAWLFHHGELLAIQVHAHPTEAYHSKTDDAYPIVTSLGGVSLVAADFCRFGLFVRAAAYRLSRDGWVEAAAPIQDLIEVV